MKPNETTTGNESEFKDISTSTQEIGQPTFTSDQVTSLIRGYEKDSVKMKSEWGKAYKNLQDLFNKQNDERNIRIKQQDDKMDKL